MEYYEKKNNQKNLDSLKHNNYVCNGIFYIWNRLVILIINENLRMKNETIKNSSFLIFHS